jgi:Domain of unknown function (DUF3576)
MKRNVAALAACAIVGLVLSGCGGTAVENANPRIAPEPGSTAGGGSALSLFSSARPAAQNQGSGIAVNAYLWRGTLETLKFMPLASADPFGGVIITDWWTPASSTGERFKATAYILGRQLRADAIRVSLFRQVQQNGQWVDAPVDEGKSAELEDVVLAKARELRAQSASN